MSPSTKFQSVQRNPDYGTKFAKKMLRVKYQDKRNLRVTYFK